MSDSALAPFQIELLDLAFQSASALPVKPHIKNRSRAQESVVRACLELEQPQRALTFVERIDSWMRGLGYAELALYLAQHGAESEVQAYLDRAREIADKPADENSQDWHRDRIRAQIVKTHVWLGQLDQAAQFEVGLVDSESGAVASARARLADASAFDEQIDVVDAIVAVGNFDQVRNTLETCAQLFDRFYQDVERRTRAETKIKASWNKLPIAVRVEISIMLAESALAHSDSSNALRVVDEAKAAIDAAKWRLEDRTPLVARLAELRFKAGDKLKARAEIDAALKLFEVERSQVVDIYRAATLRPIAEAYQVMGDSAVALSTYRAAVEAGVENPNSRPRAEDLSATCASMALHAVEPDAALRARLAQIHAALGDPW